MKRLQKRICLLIAFWGLFTLGFSQKMSTVMSNKGLCVDICIDEEIDDVNCYTVSYHVRACDGVEKPPSSANLKIEVINTDNDRAMWFQVTTGSMGSFTIHPDCNYNSIGGVYPIPPPMDINCELLVDRVKVSDGCVVIVDGCF